MSSSQNIQIAIRRMSRDDIDSIINLTRKFAEGNTSVTYRDMAATDPGGPLDLSFVALVGDGLYHSQAGLCLYPLYRDLPHARHCG